MRQDGFQTAAREVPEYNGFKSLQGIIVNRETSTLQHKNVASPDAGVLKAEENKQQQEKQQEEKTKKAAPKKTAKKKAAPKE